MKTLPTSHKHPACLECGKELYGRPDKKFCDEDCKNRFHNRESYRKRRQKNMVINCLVSNYSILENLLSMKKVSISIGDLLSMGFNPFYMTAHNRLKTHEECWCFDIVYHKSPTRIFNIRQAEKIRDDNPAER